MSVLHQHLVELAYGDDVDHTLHVVETVNPLATLRTLTTHVEHPAIAR